MTVTALTAAANGITIQREVFQHSTTIKLVIKTTTGSDYTLLISDPNGDPYIQEFTAKAYPSNGDTECENEFVRCRYPLFRPQVTDEEIWEMNKETERLYA
tara:strand:- start:353 stop:655 length:303 start_codon:yes stop_codon:yes gene_type:complete